MKVVRLSALRTGRLYPPGNIPGTHFCQRLSQPQGHSVARRIMSMKNSNDTIGNRTRDLLACSTVPQPTEPPRAPSSSLVLLFTVMCSDIFMYVTYTSITQFLLGGPDLTHPLCSLEHQGTTEFLVLLECLCCEDLQQSTLWLYL